MFQGRGIEGFDAQQGPDHFTAGGEPVVGILGKSPADDGLLARGEGCEIGAGMKMLVGELEDCPSPEWSGAGQHLLVHDCQAILVRVETDLAGERLWRGISRTQPPRACPGVMANLADQPEVAHFEAITHEEQIAGFDIQMLKSEPDRDEVKGFGRVE